MLESKFPWISSKNRVFTDPKVCTLKVAPLPNKIELGIPTISPTLYPNPPLVTVTIPELVVSKELLTKCISAVNPDPSPVIVFREIPVAPKVV